MKGVIGELVDFSLEALVDDAGNQDSSAPRSVAVLPFTTNGVTSNLGDHFSRSLETGLAEVTWVRGIDGLVIVSRRHLNDLLREQSRAMSDAFAQESVEMLGRLIGADVLITGEFTGSGDTSHLTVQVLSVSEGTVLRGRTLDLPLAIPAMIAALKSNEAADSSGTRVLSSAGDASEAPRLLMASTANELLLIDSDGRPTADIGIIISVGRSPADLALNDVPPAEDANELAMRLGTSDRQPLDLCIVLDTSASMSVDDRFVYAQFAANQIVDRLSEEDRFCLITFSSRADVRLRMTDGTDQSKEDAHRIIDSLSPSGKTNFEAALRILGHSPDERDTGSVTHYGLFISDGRPTTGMADAVVLGSMARDIAKMGMSLHTIGVSQGIRFDVLQEIADQGAGRLHTLDDAKSLATFVPYLVDRAAAMQADGAYLEFVPAPNVEVELGSSSWSSDPDGAQRSNLGLIGRDESVVRLLHVNLDPSRKLREGALVTIGSVQLSYVNPEGRAVVERVELRVSATRDTDSHGRSARLGLILTSHMVGIRNDLMHVHDLLSQGEYEDALEYLNEAIEHAELTLESRQDPIDVLAPLRRLTQRLKAYAERIKDDPNDPMLRDRVFREASGRPEV